MSRKKHRREAAHNPEGEPNEDAGGEAMDEPKAEAEEKPAGPGTDVGQIEAGELAEQAFPAKLAAEYRVIVSDGAFEAVKRHARSDTSTELCGVLAGSLFRDEDGPYLVVERAIEGVATRRSGSQVTFTHETWEHIHKQMEAECPDLRIVGWYHTHPGFGIFLSEMDQFIQDNFFNLPHQVAFVYDPVSDRRGLFIWKDGKSARLRRYWLGGDLVYDEEGGAPAAPETPRAKPAPREEEDFDRRPPRRVEREPEPEGLPLSSLAWVLLISLLGMLAAYWFGTSSTRETAAKMSRQAKDYETLIRAGLFRDGLDYELERVQRGLNDLHNKLQLAQSSLGAKPGTATAAERSAQRIDQAIEAARDAHHELGRVSNVYTAAERLAGRMERVSLLTDEVLALRMQLASLCVVHARSLLADPEDLDAQTRLQMARELKAVAVGAMPEIESQIDRLLPELAEKPKEPPKKGEEKKK